MPVSRGSMTPSCSYSQRSPPRGLLRMDSADASDRGFSIWEKPERAEPDEIHESEKKGDKAGFSRWAMSDSSLSPTFSPTSVESPFSFQGNGLGSSRSSSPSFFGELSGRPLVGMNSHTCITHEVARHDTLAGIAIRYGTEVADIKRVNGLMTDHQMFARKTLRIPLPGSHPPSPNPPRAETSSPPRLGRHRSTSLPSSLSFGPYENAPAGRSRPNSAALSPAMGMLRGYYGLPTSPERTRAVDGDEVGTELAVYKSDGEPFSEDDGLSESFERRAAARQQQRSLPSPRTRRHEGRGGGGTEEDSERGKKKKEAQKEIQEEVAIEEEDTSGRPRRPRRKSQAEEVAAVVEKLAAAARDTHIPDGVAGEDVRGGGAIGEGELASDKVVRRRGSGRIEFVEDKEGGGVENGEIWRKDGGIAVEWRGSIPGKGPVPKGKRGDGQPFGTLNGWHNMNELGDGGRGKGKLNGPVNPVRRIKSGDEGFFQTLAVPSPTLSMSPMLGGGSEGGSGSGTPSSKPEPARSFSGDSLSSLVQKISPRLGEAGAGVLGPKAGPVARKKTAMD